MLDDPTRGVDASTKSEVYQLLRESASEGMAVLWYSTEDDEMLPEGPLGYEARDTRTSPEVDANSRS